VSFNDITIDTPVTSIASTFFDAAAYTIAHYFATVSGGKLNILPASEWEGTVNDGVVSVSLPINHPKCQDLSDINRILQLVRDALAAADPHVDFAAYDTNNDGVISPHELAVVIVVAGYESAIFDCGSYDQRIWAHMFGFSFIPGANPPTLDGKRVPYYAMFGEKHCAKTTSDSTVVYLPRYHRHHSPRARPPDTRSARSLRYGRLL